MSGLRHAYVTIMGIILISYGVILNMLGAIASFVHPGSYHHGAMGTPMWCGLALIPRLQDHHLANSHYVPNKGLDAVFNLQLALIFIFQFIVFGAVNIATGLEKKREKRGIPLVLPITNILIVIVSTLCIALISWSMSASGVLTNHHVTELIVTSQQNTTDVDGNLQLSLIPVYSTIISSSTILLLMGLLSLCVDCVGMVSQARPAITAQVHRGKGWDERDTAGRTFPITEDETQYHRGDAVGEVMYGSTPAIMPSVQVVKTIERPSFHHHMDTNEGNHHGVSQRHTNRPQHDNAYQTGHAHRTGHTHQQGHAHQPGHAHPARHEQGQSKHATTHQPLSNERDQTNRQYPYQPNSAPNLREIERAERRPNPYFYL